MSDYLFDLLGVRERLIMDPVHGGITLFGHEVQVIDHPLFQRLRYICQNDILSLVFPGATHSRFLHSIGTLHVGSRMYQSLIESALRKYRDQRQASLTVAQLKAIAYMAKVVRLACLLHDCGHSSFSHQFTESVTIRSLLAEPGRFEKLWGGVNFRAYHQCQPAQLEHEHYSVRCAYEIMNSVQSDLVQGIRDDVLTLMDTTDTTPSEAFIYHAHQLWPVLTRQKQAPETAGILCAELLSLLISGEIDADRADYMLRDGFHSSVTLGGFNLDHLLKNVHVGWSPDCKWLGLGITRKGLGTLEDFVYSRYQMYRKVYGHKTSIGFDWLLRRAIDEVLEDQESRLYIDHCLASMQGFQTLTDNYFWEAFRRHAERCPDSASYDLVYRKRLQHLASAENLSPEQAQDMAEVLARQHDLPVSRLICCTLKARFSNIKTGFCDIKVFESGDYRAITDCSEFFQKFNDQTLFHFYINPRRY